MKKKKLMAMILPLMLTMCLGACGGQTAPASDTGASGASAGTEASKTAETAADQATDGATLDVSLPEDNGMTGIFKWIEMEDQGLPIYLILWDDGIGSIDIIGTGTVRGVFYDNETMKVADEGAVSQKYTYADDKLTWTYSDDTGEHVSTFVRLTAQEREAYEAIGIGSTADGSSQVGNASPWPEDNGGLAGVYKWVEMEKVGVTANLILFSDGTGVFDMLGVVESVKYDDNTMQSSGEGALPQSYTYADGTLTWTSIEKNGGQGQISTFVKLTPEELSAYEARGIGKAQ